jgi:hypothetical protein
VHTIFCRGTRSGFGTSVISHTTLDLKALECSQPVNDPLGIVRFGEVKIVPSFSWISSFGSELLFPPILITTLATLILACAAYGVIRTIGWVIGGFAA